MHNKLNTARLQRNLNQANDEITEALLYLNEIVVPHDAAAARTECTKIYALFTQLYAQTLSLKRRIRDWTMTYPDLSECTDSHILSDMPDFFQLDGTWEEREDEEEDEDEHEDNEGFFADHDSAATYFGFEDETAGQGAPQSQNEIVWEGQEMQHPRDEPIDDSQYAISDAEIGRLFDISAASAAAGVKETGYLDIFGAWIEGRRPGPYERPVTPPPADDPDDTEPDTDA